MPLMPIIIALLIFIIVVWVISILPVPAVGPAEHPFPVKVLLYVLAALVLILYLLRYV